MEEGLLTFAASGAAASFFGGFGNADLEPRSGLNPALVSADAASRIASASVPRYARKPLFELAGWEGWGWAVVRYVLS